MFSIDTIYQAGQEIKKSNFISYLCPFSEFKDLHEKLKKEHTKASHIVWAYRHQNQYLQIIENSSDDSEPKGSGGQPSLDALRGAKLINVGLFTVRYFGGIKLGIGGLVRAYLSSANLVINASKLMEFKIKNQCKCFVPFAIISRFEYFFEKEKIKPNEKFYNSKGCFYDFYVDVNEFDKLNKVSAKFNFEGFYFILVPIFNRKK